MKKIIIVALVCLNMGLLVALVAGTATGQPTPASGDYALFTGKIEVDHDAVYLIDFQAGRMIAWRFDMETKRLRPYRTRSLRSDFFRQRLEEIPEQP